MFKNTLSCDNRIYFFYIFKLISITFSLQNFIYHLFENVNEICNIWFFSIIRVKHFLITNILSWSTYSCLQIYHYLAYFGWQIFHKPSLHDIWKTKFFWLKYLNNLAQTLHYCASITDWWEKNHNCMTNKNLLQVSNPMHSTSYLKNNYLRYAQ